MPLEITGLIHHNSSAPMAPKPLSLFEAGHIAVMAQAQEAAGYDRVLLANSAVMPDPLNIGTFVAAQTRALQLMIAHRPGVIAPTLAARMLATIDRLSNGRAGVHIIAGPNDRELQADGDYLGKDDRYRRSLEYVGILRALWQAQEPIDHAGEFYRFDGAFAEVKPVQRPALPIFWGGTSGPAIALGAQCADIYALTGDSLRHTRELVDRIRAAAHACGRDIGFQITFLAIVADSEDAAWAIAARRLAQVVAINAQQARDGPPPGRPTNFSSKSINANRLLQTAAEGPRVDRCLWTEMNSATQTLQGNQSTLVGTPDQVAEALMDYYDMGIGNVLLRGYAHLEDVPLFGRALIPRIRALAAERDAARASAGTRA